MSLNKNTDVQALSGYLSTASLSEWLACHKETRPDKVAIWYDGAEITYGELAGKVESLAAGLSSLGLKAGDRVGLQVPNSPEFIISYLAVCRIGGVVQMLHMPYRKKELRYLVSDSGAKAVICLAAFKEQSPAEWLVEIRDENNLDCQVISLGGAVSGSVDFASIASGQPPLTGDYPAPDSDFALLYTSGTTADPKGILHSYDSFLGNALVATGEFEIDESDRMLCPAAFSHLYGLFTLNMMLSVGGTVILMPVFSPPALKELLLNSRPTCLFAAPAHMAASIRDGLVAADELSSVKLLCMSGSAVPPELAKSVDNMLANGNVIQLWGMSELQAGAYCRPTDDPEIRFASAGRSSPGTELRVQNTDGVTLPPGEEGELQVRGPSVFSEYLNKEAETASSFLDDGWFQTGDLAILGENGSLKITGRVKELINRGGVKYNPLEVEEIILKIPAIQQCAIAPVADDVLGEIACLYVVVNDGESIDLDQVCAFLSEAEIAKYKWPERIRTLATMPMTPTNKVARSRLADS